MKGPSFHFISPSTAMLTGPSPSPIQHRPSTTADSFLASLDPPPTRSLSRALRFSTNTDFFQKSAKPVDSRKAGASPLRRFSMVPSAKSSSKGKEHGVFDSLETPSYRTFLLPASPRRTSAHVLICSKRFLSQLPR